MRELMAFREHVFRHVQEDWRDVVARAGSLWSPRRRRSQSTAAAAAAAAAAAGVVGAVAGTDTDMDTEGTNTATGSRGDISAAAIVSIPASSCKVVPPIAAASSDVQDVADGSSGSGASAASAATSGKEATAQADLPSGAASSTADIITASEDIRPVAAAIALEDGISGAPEDPKAQEAEEMVVVEESAIPEFWIPGRIVHIYAYRGQYRAVEVPRDFPTLRKIELQGNSFNDHNGTKIFDALLEVRIMV